ncbi:MAG: hypothetical protein BM561_06960 [Vibrio sp. MedPE-SWchi]|nr:MAG: hypothetical protein BM561_06960 [Vibrio sp. MedPE-SWchi]
MKIQVNNYFTCGGSSWLLQQKGAQNEKSPANAGQVFFTYRVLNLSESEVIGSYLLTVESTANL